MMDKQIIQLIADPVALEQLYRSNPAAFSSAFHAVYPQISSEI
jgi:dipeptide/tripeptide permease